MNILTILGTILPFGAPLAVWLYFRHITRERTEWLKRHFMHNWGATVEINKKGFITKITTKHGDVITYN